MTDTNIDVVVAGHICLDIIPAFLGKAGELIFADLFRPGKLTQMGRIVMSSGGPVSNTGTGLQILGVKAELMGKYGDDPLARNLREILASRDQDRSMVQVRGEQTSYTVVLAPPGIDRMFLHCPGANDTYCADDLNDEVIARTRIFHLGYPPLMKRLYSNDGAELTEIFRRVKTKFPGVLTSLDMSLPDPATESGKVNWRKVLENTLPYVDFYLPSAEETFFMLHPADFLKMRDEARGKDIELLDLIPAERIMSLGEELLSLGSKVSNVKSGHRGIFTRTAKRAELEKVPHFTPELLDSWSNRQLWHAAFHVDPIASATGSGDSSISGFLASFLRHCPLEEALRMANAVGGCNVTAMDAISGIRNWDETRKLVEAGWENKPPNIDAPGWTELVSRRLWAGPSDRK